MRLIPLLASFQCFTRFDGEVDMFGEVTIQPSQQGTDQTIWGMVKDYYLASWDMDPVNGIIAVVTFQTMAQFVNSETLIVTIYPKYYTLPDNTPLDSIFCIGSVQKVFTGTMLAARILDGSMIPSYALTSPVRSWLPEAVANAAPTDRIYGTTLAQLATHSSCLQDNVPGMDAGLYNSGGAPDTKQINAWLSNTEKYWRASCTPGLKSQYSNWGSLTLGFAVTQPDDYVYNTTLARYILPSFGMNADSTSTLVSTPCVPGYKPDGTRAEGTAHGIRSSINDMTSFLANYMSYQIQSYYWPAQPLSFPCQVVNLALTPPISEVPNVALDWFLSDRSIQGRTYTIYGKNGETNAQGFSTYVGFSSYPISSTHIPLLQVQSGVIVLTNKAMQGRQPKPPCLGTNVLQYLIGGVVADCPGEDRVELDSDD